jgi:hypothetical protein
MNESSLIEVPTYAHLKGYQRTANDLTVTFAATPEADGSLQALEVWLKMGEKHYVVIAQVSEQMEPLSGVAEFTRSKAALLSADQQVGTVEVRTSGDSVSLVGLEPELREALIVSRWVPASVPEPFIPHRVTTVRVSSITVDQEALPQVRPNLVAFFKPLYEEFKRQGGR